MCISKSVCREMRCSRSPKPVNVGVKTECPSRRMRSATFRHCQPPPQVPCTSTKFVIVSIFPALLWRFCIEAAKNIHCLDHLSLAGGEGVEILAAAKKQALRSLKD